MIGPRTGVGARPHRVTLQNPGPPLPDGAGGYTQMWADLVPPVVSAEIKPATAADLERVTSETIVASATYVVTLPYHAGVTTKTRIIFNGRFFTVAGVGSPDERQAETITLCEEVVP